MARTYRVICANNEGAVIALANRDGWTILQPIRPFVGIESEDDGSLAGPDGSEFGGFLTHKPGAVALCYKEI